METMAPKPLKRLTVVCSARNTPLKQGVNEILSRRMQRLLSSCLIQFIPLLILAVLPVHGAETNRLVITHATVIDGTGSAPQENVTVVVSRNRIATMGKSTEVNVPASGKIVDATGKFLIPGLWDMHVHWHEKDYLPLFIA